MIQFPPSTLVGKAVPKTAFYRNLEVNAKIKQRFVDDVASITWTAKIAPSTLNVPMEVLSFIDRLIPRHTVFLLQYNDDFCLLLNYNELADPVISSAYPRLKPGADEVHRASALILWTRICGTCLM